MGFDFGEFLSQAFIITTVVIMMMMLIEFVNAKTHGKLLILIKKYPNLQIVFAALIGLIPGCVGIFAVVSLYTHRLLTFGALLATAIASFGDEAFLMFSLIPRQTIWICLILFCLAVIFGYCADFFLRKKKKTSLDELGHDFELHLEDHHHHSQKEVKIKYAWKTISWHRIVIILLTVFFLTGIITGFLGHNHDFADSFSLSNTHTECEVTHNHEHQHNYCSHDHHSHSPFEGENLIFLLIGFLALILVLCVNNHFLEEHIWGHVVKKHFLKIFLWVFFIMLFVKLLGFFIPIESLAYHAWGKIILLMIALLIALIPESGPNLIILFLFIDGVVPFSTLLANSILQEGHGGLPLIAENPRSFLWMKVIKFVIAFLVGIIGYWIGF